MSKGSGVTTCENFIQICQTKHTLSTASLLEKSLGYSVQAVKKKSTHEVKNKIITEAQKVSLAQIADQNGVPHVS
jgi:hypothetical protein